MSAFLSYSHADREYGAQAKRVLAEFDIEAFLAHEDLEVSEEWQARILAELRRCDLFVPLLSANFLASKWASQEAGFIASRPEVVITPLSIDGTTPFGFLSHLQSRRIPTEGLTREFLIDPLATRMPRTALPALIRIAGAAKNFRDAEIKMHRSCASLPPSPHKRLRHLPKRLQKRADLVGQPVPDRIPASFPSRSRRESRPADLAQTSISSGTWRAVSRRKRDKFLNL